ncbi:hypothetical protein [Paenibacillus odorifer]|uniref:hypothetical protein n=2 Tax=Paenibacillus TaxID=44249 RepID=UPI00096F748F|nr:hypothetical protein [Paenibacillus odorifer]OMD18523.1 hypothetical protein BJP50_14445 [Paenibacillus odorifer]
MNFWVINTRADDFSTGLKMKQIVRGIDKTKNRVTILNEILDELKLGHISVYMNTQSAFGITELMSTNPFQVASISLADPDCRNEKYLFKTLFHELYHACVHNLKHDTDIIGYENWLKIEEVAAETSAHYICKLMGYSGETAFSYSKELVEILPKLKRIPDFQNCNSIVDFGGKFIKYRFNDNNKSAEWATLYNVCSGITIDMKNYSLAYKADVMDNIDLIALKILEMYNEQDLDTKKGLWFNKIKQRILDQWTKTEGEYFYLSLAFMMNKNGVN